MLHEKGGSGLKASDVKDFLNKSYSTKRPSDYGDFVVDSYLSDNNIQVYKYRNSGQAIVVHRGLYGINDWIGNYKEFMGSDTSRSIKVKIIQEAAEKKYESNTVSTLCAVLKEQARYAIYYAMERRAKM